MWSSSSTPWHVPKRNANIGPHRNSHMNVLSTIIHNSQNVETTQMFIKWWIFVLETAMPRMINKPQMVINLKWTLFRLGQLYHSEGSFWGPSPTVQTFLHGKTEESCTSQPSMSYCEGGNGRAYPWASLRSSDRRTPNWWGPVSSRTFAKLVTWGQAEETQQWPSRASQQGFPWSAFYLQKKHYFPL